ncbi:MAG: hypothetical protein DRN17_02830 [Thermoplasmata archaeon]|nr:MAG: hypothetical protein DRN17_02830 [Thermoplasmata archaeon]
MYDKEKEEKEKNGRVVGIDVGIKSTIMMSDGEVLSLDKDRIMKLVRKIERLQSIIDTKREINRKRGIKYSKRVEELERKRDRLFKKIENIKQDFYYKAVNHILNSHEYVAVEDLDLDKLRQVKHNNRKAEKNIHKYLMYTSLGKFFNILEYKAQLYGREVIKVDAKDTSKTCSNCGYVFHRLKLSDRTFRCPQCNFKIDRDLNASINILKRGLEHLAPSAGQVEYMPEMVIAR